MSVILAIETSTEIASAALLVEHRLLTRESTGVQTHSQTILPMVHSLLAEAGISLKQCDAIAFGAGPGSFTGVRTACGVVQGLAFGADRPVVPVVTLEAMAQACRELHGAADVLAVLDARMGEVYWAQYRFDAGWREVLPPALSSVAEVKPDGIPVACGNGLTAYEEQWSSPGMFMARHGAVMPHAAQVAALGEVGWRAGKAMPAHNAQPLYLRNKVALTIAERQAKAVA